MRIKSRSRPVVFLSLLMAILMLMMSVCSVLHPVEVSAAKNQKVDGLIMVQPYGGNHMAKMEAAVKSQWSNEGTADANQHKWLYSLNDVMGNISSNQETREKHPVVIWAAGGTKWLDSKDTATFGAYYDRSNIGSDSSAGLDAPNYNGTGFGRLLYGYDYKYEFVWKVWEVNGQEVYDEDYSSNPNSGTDVCTDGSNPNLGSNPKPVYSEHDHCTDTHHVYQDEDGVWHDDCGNPAHHGHSEHEHCTQKTEKVVRTFHVEGVIERWHKTYSDLKVYVFATGPRSKEYLGNEVLANNQIEMREPLNDAPQAFNNALKGLCPDFVEAFEQMYQNNPYFEAGNDAKKGSSPNYYYSDEFYRFIFHMMWNTILTLNPNDEPPEPINETLYSLSSSLTAYMNNILSSEAAEKTDGTTHVLGAANTNYVGNAGAFLGYNDKDYGKNTFITGKHSKTSSVIDYKALLGVEGKTASNSTNEMYLYARYGYLLSDLGLDDTSTRLSFGSAHMIPGALMFLAYALSEGIVVVFEKIIDILQLLNPFQFFAKNAAIQSAISSGVVNSPVSVTNVDDTTSTIGSTTTALTGSSLTAHIPQKILDFVGDAYKAFQDFGLEVTIPFFLVLFLVGALLYRRRDTMDKAKSLLFRFAFICIGVPIMGMLYTATLENIEDYTSSSVSSGTQLVASTFVDFKGWAQQYRLSPLSDAELGSTVLVSDADSGSYAGQASDASYNNLRKTAAIINKKTGAITDVDWSNFKSSLTDVQKWSSNGLTMDGSPTTSAFRQAASLLQSYTMGDFYTAGTFESDTMSALSKNHSVLLGRQQGVDEEDSVDNTDTVFEMFSETNELDKWTGRDNAENQAIFKQTGDYASKWKQFNVFANGGLKADNNKADNTKNVTYTAERMNIKHNTGVCPDSQTGLSTMSMYNYLSTTFQSGQMIIYSNERAASEYTKQQHYAVNLIGSGVARMLYFMSCFSVLFVSSIIGVYYAISMIIQNVKRSVKLLLSIPGVMMGSMRSIVSTIMICVMMIVELFATMITYMLISELLVAFVQVIESPLAEWVNNALSTAVIGGHIATIGSVDISAMMGTKLGLFVNLGVSACLIFALGYFAKKQSVRFVFAWSLCMEYVILRYIVPIEVRNSYLYREQMGASKDVRNTSNQSVFTITKDLLLQC